MCNIFDVLAKICMDLSVLDVSIGGKENNVLCHRKLQILYQGKAVEQND